MVAYRQGFDLIEMRPMGAEPGPKCFFDSNVLLYMLSPDAFKADQAEAVLRESGAQHAQISVQVLNEITHVARRKAKMSWSDLNDWLASLCSVCTICPLTLEMHNHGREIAQKHGLSVYDAMIVAAALATNCAVLYSEDMQNGRTFEEQLRIVNPFVPSDDPMVAPSH